MFAMNNSTQNGQDKDNWDKRHWDTGWRRKMVRETIYIVLRDELDSARRFRRREKSSRRVIRG